MLEPIQGAREDRPSLVPDDLLVVKEANAQQTVQNFACKLRSVPDISNLKTGNQPMMSREALRSRLSMVSKPGVEGEYQTAYKDCALTGNSFPRQRRFGNLLRRGKFAEVQAEAFLTAGVAR